MTQKTKSGWVYDCCKCGKGAPFGVERPNGDLHYCYEHWPSKPKTPPAGSQPTSKPRA
ncbi:hypothetical protein [Gluconobacter thailandicus]|uniref:hypothetical protein n=1 Tax=Gluconobacter thailandicus TaxID=257438 RepID=UPI00142F4276|nr:hypothetical protein [Gluconobacter thailandicus]